MKIPCDYNEAMVFDADNGNSDLKDSDLLELRQVYNFDNFKSLGPVNKACIPPGHTKI